MVWFMKVHWIHDFASEPVWLFSEIENDWEIRKVEVYRDGRMDYADQWTETGATGLGLVPIPSMDDIAADPQFVPVEIDAAGFEKVWQEAHV